MTALRRLLVVGMAAALAGSLAACGNEPAPLTVDDTEAEVSPATVRLPSQVVGLRVQHEEAPTEQVAQIDRPYIDSIAIFSLREDELLRATLQVSRLGRAAEPESARFRRAVVQQLGHVEPVELNVAGRTIHVTGASERAVYVWFDGRGMYVLSIHRDFVFPRTLVRRLLESDLQV